MERNALLLITFCFVIISCVNLGKTDQHIKKINAVPSLGFDFDYYLFVPSIITKSSILVIPNNSGFVDDDISKHEKRVQHDIASFGKMLAAKLNCVLLIPVFPRTKTNGQVYTHALDRDTLQRNDIRLDIQLINMISNARQSKYLEKYNLDDKIYLFGFSASGMFSNRFSLIHPNIVKAVACGSPGGWVIAPLNEYNGITLTYPVGIYDLEDIAKQTIDLESFKMIPQFYFIGSKDKNDSVPYTDGYDIEQKDVVFSLFGEGLIKRFTISEKIYKEIGANVQFKVYQDVGHIITDEMLGDTIAFFNRIR